MISRVLCAALIVAVFSLPASQGGWNNGPHKRFANGNGGPRGRKLSAGGTSGHGGAAGAAGGSHYWWQDSKPFSTPTNGKHVVQHQQQQGQHGGSWGPQSQPQQQHNAGGSYPQQQQQRPQVVPPGPVPTSCNPGYECVPYDRCENGVVVAQGHSGVDLRSQNQQLKALGSPCGDNHVCCQSAGSYNVPGASIQQPSVVPSGPSGCAGGGGSNGGCSYQQPSKTYGPPRVEPASPQEQYIPPQTGFGCGGAGSGGCGQAQQPQPQQTYVQPAPQPQQTYVQPAPQPQQTYVQPAPQPQQTYVQPAPQPQQTYVQPAQQPQTYVPPAPQPAQVPTGCGGVGCLQSQQPQPQPDYVAPVQALPVAPRPALPAAGGLFVSSKPYVKKPQPATGTGCGPSSGNQPGSGCGPSYNPPPPQPAAPYQPAPQPAAPYQPPPQPVPQYQPAPAPQPAAPYQPPPPAPTQAPYRPPPPTQRPYQPPPKPAPKPYQPPAQPQPRPVPVQPSYQAPKQPNGCGPGNPGCGQPAAPQQPYRPPVQPPKPSYPSGGCGGPGAASCPNQVNGGGYQPKPAQGGYQGQAQRPFPVQQRPSPVQNSIGGYYPNRNAGESVTYKPYTGPTAPSVPFPGCSAGLLCVEYSLCNATGYIIPAPDPVDAQNSYRVAVMDCTEPESGIVGICCRDPNYVDPWPGGMMMSGPGMKNMGKRKRDVAAVLGKKAVLDDKLLPAEARSSSSDDGSELPPIVEEKQVAGI